MEFIGTASSQTLIMLFALSSLSVGGVLFALLAPTGDRQSRAKSRLDKVSRRSRGRAHQRQVPDQGKRKRKIEDTLREIDERHKVSGSGSGKPTLESRLSQAGLTWSKGTYILISIVVGAVGFLLAMTAFGLGMVPSVGFGVAAGLIIPHAYVAHKRKTRFNKFSAEFPNALDVIVRGIKSGIPLVDCLKTIATEAQDPVRSEFQEINEDQTLGVPLDEAIARMAKRIPISEANFFAIVIAIQSRTGGNLSEALGNLSTVLRDRKNLRGKIRAMSAEAKASAGIIGAMPVVVTALLAIISPDYIALLVTTTLGNVVTAGSLIWMFIGVMVMRNMINFDI
jgi:tight adherence protein B